MPRERRAPEVAEERRQEMRRIGTRIREARLAVGLSQELLGEKVGRSRDLVNQVENGYAGLPLDLVAPVAQELALDPQALMFAADWADDRKRVSVQFALLPAEQQKAVLALVAGLLPPRSER